MRAPLTQSLGGVDLSSWRTCLRGAGAALTRAEMAATMEILTNILELDPGMQLSRKLGGELLFIPRVKLGSNCKADPKLVHYRPVYAREQFLGGGAGTTGVRSENCRRPLQKTGSWHVERRAEGHMLGCTRQVVVATGGSLICNFMKLICFSANDCVKRQSFPCETTATPVE
jgi:hypothetical protein